MAKSWPYRQLKDLSQADFGRVNEKISSFAKETVDNQEFCGKKVTPIVCFCNCSTQKSRLFLSVKVYYVYMINIMVHSCLQIWNFFSRVQRDTNSKQFIVFCSIPYSFTSLTHEIASWTLEEKFVIKVHLCIILYLLNKDKMADFVVQPRYKIPEKLPYSMNFNAWRGSIAQWSVFIRPNNHRLLTTEKVVDECKAIKPLKPLKLCKPETQLRVRITFKKFSNLPIV